MPTIQPGSARDLSRAGRLAARNTESSDAAEAVFNRARQPSQIRRFGSVSEAVAAQVGVSVGSSK